MIPLLITGDLTMKGFLATLARFALGQLGNNQGVQDAITGGFGRVIGGIFGGKRAYGGPVNSGSSYLVGERGPELFQPRVSGNIIPNGGRSVNVQRGAIVIQGGSTDAETRARVGLLEDNMESMIVGVMNKAFYAN